MKNTTPEKNIKKELASLKIIWNDLKKDWKENNFQKNPLRKPAKKIKEKEKLLSDCIVSILNYSQNDSELLYRYSRAQNNKNKIHYRAAIHVTNVCRANCACCPMRRDNYQKENVRRITTEEIIGSVKIAYSAGYRDIFIQGGEDPYIIKNVSEAIKIISKKYNDVEFTLNLGNLSSVLLKKLYEAGVRKYVIKYETSNPQLHQTLRQDKLENRIKGILKARKVGFELGSGNIIGLPKQKDHDLANDIILLGRLDIKNMISSTPYTPSEALPNDFRKHPAANWGKSKRFIAILRLLFPDAHIHAPSNADSNKIKRLNSSVSGQRELIEAGADEISVEFTPARIARHYGLYEKASERHVVTIQKAISLKKELA